MGVCKNWFSGATEAYQIGGNSNTGLWMPCCQLILRHQLYACFGEIYLALLV